MFSSLNRLWWSRLVISVRGYVINYVQQNDDVLFSCDDAFIKIHQKLAEKNSQCEEAFEVGTHDFEAVKFQSFQYLTAIFHLIREKNTLIQLISNPRNISTTKITPNLDRSFSIIHGDLSPKAIQLTIGTTFLSFVFYFLLLSRLPCNNAVFSPVTCIHNVYQSCRQLATAMGKRKIEEEIDSFRNRSRVGTRWESRSLPNVCFRLIFW